jgi:adenosine deaminase
LSQVNWPKSVTELHVHLGGSVPLYRLWEIAVDRGIRGMAADYEAFINTLKLNGEEIHDLDTYLETYDKVELIQSGPHSVRECVRIASNVAYRTGGMVHLGPGGEGGSPHSLFNIGKLELRFNPLKRTGAVFLKGQHAGLYDIDRVIKSACDAVDEVELAFRGKLRVGLIFCFGRDMTHEANLILAKKTALWAKRSRSIVGVDLAGAESRNPLSDPERLREMTQVFAEIPPELGRTIHVGETPHVSVDTFIKTIEALNPKRVAHPIVAFRSFWENGDERGLRVLVERDIVCEFCIKSNLLTRAVKSIEEYARVLRTADKFNIRYTFSTDAPALQVTSLAQELTLLLERGVASAGQILCALTVAEEASFLPPLELV